MYVMDQRPPRRPPPTSPFPTYDVKIIAGRRVVIFHDRNKDGDKGDKHSGTANAKQKQEHEQSNIETIETR